MAILKPGQLASGSYTISGSFSGSFQGSGAGLNNIPSSAIVGLSSTQIASGAVTASVSEGTGSFTVTSGSSTFMFISSSGNVGLGTNIPFNGLNAITSIQLPSYGNIDVGGFCSLGKITVSGYGAVGSNYYLNSSNQLRRKNGDYVSVIDFSASGFLFKAAGNGAANSLISLSEYGRFAPSTGNFLIGTTTDAGYKLDVNGTARMGNTSFSNSSINIVDSGQIYSNGTIALQCFQGVGNNRSVLVNINPNTTSITDAAILAANSTTKGFLPPRTTLTSNISSSIQGLMTYINSGSNEGLYYYNSGSAIGWHKVLTNSGSQEISGSLGVTGSISVTSGNVILNSNRIYLGNNATQMLYTSGADVYLENGATSRKIIFNNTSAGVFQFNNGNVLINTTTDAGFRLDVNGTARVSGNLTVATGFQFLFNNNNVGLYRDANTLRLGGFGGIEFLASATNISAQSIRMKVFDTGNVGINTTTDAGFRLDVNGTARVVNNIFSGNGTYFTTGSQSIASASTANAFVEISSGASNSAALVFSKAGSLSTLWQLYSDSSSNIAFFRNGVNKEIFKIFESTKNIGIDEVSGTSTFLDVASAKLFVNSTTKGFLPPRMTTTQKNAIATPAEGLMVYDTVLKRPCFYDGTSWVTL